MGSFTEKKYSHMHVLDEVILEKDMNEATVRLSYIW